jgi:ABC-type phosphate transport system auxiliary subunit
MLLIKLLIDVPFLAGIIVIAFASGFLLRTAQLRKQKNRVFELEKEMMASHAEILDLQKERLELEGKLKGSSNIPVIPITAKEEKKSDKLQDKSAGKK